MAATRVVAVFTPINRRHSLTCTTTTNAAGVATCNRRNVSLRLLFLGYPAGYTASTKTGAAYNAARTHGVIGFL